MPEKPLSSTTLRRYNHRNMKIWGNSGLTFTLEKLSTEYIGKNKYSIESFRCGATTPSRSKTESNPLFL